MKTERFLASGCSLITSLVSSRRLLVFECTQFHSVGVAGNAGVTGAGGDEGVAGVEGVAGSA
jgi:hypothetical protein